MKIVLDTNVLISGIFFSCPPHQVLMEWKKGNIEIVISNEILTEYRRVAEELSKKFPNVDIKQILNLFTFHAKFFDTTGFSVSICKDPDDDMGSERNKSAIERQYKTALPCFDERG